MKTFSRPPIVYSDREKLLLVGSSGTKKTSACIQLAVQYPDVGVAILDLDDGVSRVVRDYGGFAAVPNLIHLPAVTWEQVEEQYDFAKSILEPGDWMAIDMVGRLYAMAQEDYVRRKYAKSMEEFRFDKKEANKTLGFGGLSPDDWGVIQLAHDSITQDAIRRLPCNVVLTAGTRPIIFVEKRNGGNTETVPLHSAPDKWVSRKVTPDMEKHIDYAVSTILYLSSRDLPRGRNEVDLEFTMSTVGKDRGRSPVNQTWNSLWLDYIKAVGLDEYTTRSPGQVGGAP